MATSVVARDSQIASMTISDQLSDAGFAFDQIFPGTPMLNLMLIKDTLGKSKRISTNNRVIKKSAKRDIEVKLQYAKGNTLQWFDGYDVITISPKDFLTNAKYAWSHAVGNCVIDNKDIIRNSGSETGITSIVESALANMASTIADGLNEALFAMPTAVTAKQMHSIPELVQDDPTSAYTVGGIAQNTAANVYWRNQTKDSVATTYQLLLREIRNLALNCSYNNANDYPDVLATDQYVYEYAINYLESKMVPAPKNEELAKLLNLKDVPRIEGMDLIWDRLVPNQYGSGSYSSAFTLNTKYLHFVMAEERTFEVTDLGSPLPTGTGYQDAHGWLVTMMLQLICTNRNKQGSLAKIAQDLAA